MDRQTQADEIRRLTAAADVMLGSVHAVSESGSLLAASMTGSQLAPYVAGAGQVILVVGTQKIVSGLEQGFLRILDVELPNGGSFRTPIAADFNAFVWMLQGEAKVGANGKGARRSQIVVVGPGGALTVSEAAPGTRFMLMAGKPYGETPIYNGPYVD